MKQKNIRITWGIIPLVAVVILVISVFIYLLFSNLQKESASISEEDLKVLISEARFQNRLPEFGIQLATEGSKDSITKLLKAINLVEKDEKEILARGLQALELNDASVELLNFLIKNSDDSIVAVQIRDALARVSDGEDVIRLSEAISNLNLPEQGLVRSYLLGTISRISKEEAIPTLITLATISDDSAIYTSTIVALGLSGYSNAVFGLVEIIEKRKIENINDSAVQALINFKTNKDSVNALIKVRDEVNNSIIRNAVNNAIETYSSSQGY